MAKTRFGPGVIVTSEWLNGSQQLYFDGQVDLDWHYNPLTVLDVQRTNPSRTGFNDQYVTTQTAQTNAGGQAIVGEKEFRSHVSFGVDQTTFPAATYSVAPTARYTATNDFLSQIYADADRDFLIVNWGLLQQQFGALNISDLLSGCSIDPLAPVPDDDGKMIKYDYTLGDYTCTDTIDGGDF
jgi:hypothetical protein